MSLHKYTLKDGSPRWRVKYYAAGKQRYEATAVYNDAKSMDAAIHQARSSMDPEAFNRLMASWRSSDRIGGAGGFRTFAENWRKTSSGITTQTLAEHYAEWIANCEGRLRQTTIDSYECMWNVHIKDALGHYPLQRIEDEPQLIDAWAARMNRSGVGPGSQRRAIIVLGACLKLAVRWRKIKHNPCIGLHKPSAKRKRGITLIPPVQVERLCSVLEPRDALLVRILAYAGLRPGEALALRGKDVGRTILVDKAISGSRRDAPKNMRGHRSVKVSEVVRELLGDLPDGYLFLHDDGRFWSKDDWTTWMRRLRRTAAGIGINLGRAYDLRHTFVSLMIRSGRNVVEVAAQAGHSPAECLKTYSHVFAELESEPRRDVDAMIREAAGVGIASHQPVTERANIPPLEPQYPSS